MLLQRELVEGRGIGVLVSFVASRERCQILGVEGSLQKRICKTVGAGEMLKSRKDRSLLCPFWARASVNRLREEVVYKFQFGP
jgi:hypothetical protein